MGFGNAVLSGFIQEPDAVFRRGNENPYVIRSDRQSFAIGERAQFSLTNSALRPIDRKTVFISELGDERLRLRSALPIYLEQAGEQVLAYSYDLEELEVGEDEWQVIAKMKAAIVDAYYILKGEQQNLGPVMLVQWNFLKKVIAEA